MDASLIAERVYASFRLEFMVGKRLTASLAMWSFNPSSLSKSDSSISGRGRIYYAIFAATLLISLNAATIAQAALLKKQNWGWLDGVQTAGASTDFHRSQLCQRVTVQNDLGMQVSYIDYGATLVGIDVPDRRGRFRNVILSLPNLAAYGQTQRRFGAVMGRYAGRIGGAHFTLDGNSYNLPANMKGLALHGDPDGFDKRLWQRTDFYEADSLGSVFRLVSPAGDQGFPGQLEVRVTYRIFKRTNVFQIEYSASTDAPTVLNLTNHAFFNLSGAGTTDLASHRFQINADRYAQTDALRVPTGEILPVVDTVLDFRRPAGVIDRLRQNNTLLGMPSGFDHSLIFAKARSALPVVGVIDDWRSGRRLRIRTTEPSVQFNTGNGFDGSEVGSEGVAYPRHAGFAFETQHLPDSPNHPHFPSTVLRPGSTFHSVTRYEFSVLPKKAR